MFILGLILFIGSPGNMAYIWLHVGHFARGLIGFAILSRLPKSHDVVDELEIPETNDGSHYTIESISDLLKSSVSKIFIRQVESCRKFVLSYAILTWICLTLDLIEFLIHYVRFGYPGGEHSDLAMLFLTVIFLGFDIFYLAWAIQAKDKFPAVIADAVSKALLGSVEKINLQLYETVKKARQEGGLIRKVVGRGGSNK
jgi:hypothetical protein